MSLPEDIRQEYLQVLGIDSYYPRVKLPAAPESVQCEIPESWTADIQTETEKPVSITIKDLDENEEKQEAIEQVAEEKAALTDTPAINAEEEVAQGSTDKAKSVTDECRLQIACIRVNNSLAIINAMPHLGPKNLPAQHVQLLRNILHGSGVAHGELHIEDKPFLWPMVQGQGMDNSKVAAASALTAYLEQKFSDWQFQFLLVMGEQAITSVFSSEDEEEQSPALDQSDWTVGLTRSLDEFLQSPGLKKELWPVFRIFRS